MQPIFEPKDSPLRVLWEAFLARLPVAEICGSRAPSACGLASRVAIRVASASRSCGSFWRASW